MELQYEWGKRTALIIEKLEEESRFVRIREKHGDAFHLITCEQDLVDVMLHYVKSWVDSHWLPREDWYFTGSYDEFFKKEMGVTVAEYTKVLQMCEGMTIEAIQKLKEKGDKMKRRYFHEQDGLATAKFYRDVIDNGLGKRAGLLYSNLSQQTYNDVQMFNFEQFDPI